MSQYAPSTSSSSSKSIFIAIMGVTGSGKSTFISHCTKQHVEIGHNLRACMGKTALFVAHANPGTGTQEVKVYDCHQITGVTVKLVDTPGFDDTSRSDTDVLREIASWLTASYSHKIKLHGIIYLHRISDPKMPGSGKKNLHMFENLCGPDALRHVTLATTMWENVEIHTGATRENELRDIPECWGDMISQGSRLERHTNDQESAIRLLSMFVEASDFVVDLQRQIVDQNKSLNQTAAGMEFETELTRARAKFQKEIDGVKKNMEDAIKHKDEESARQLQLQNQEWDEKLRRVNEEQAKLESTLQQEHNRRYAEIKAELQGAKSAADARELRQTRLLKHQLQARKVQDEKHKEQIRKHQKQIQNLRRQFQIKQPGQPSMDDTAVTTKNHGSFSSLSLVGKFYTFIHSHGSSFRLPWTLNTEREKDEYYFQYVALGTRGSWYQHYTKANHENPMCQRSGNFADQYPGLAEAINTHQLYSKPECLSLGVNGNYFAYIGKNVYYALDDATKKHIGDMKNVSRMWLGKNGAYVAVLSDGALRWNLRRGYAELETFLEERRGSISALAMNLENDHEYVAVCDSTWYIHMLNDPVEKAFQMCLWKNGYPPPGE